MNGHTKPISPTFNAAANPKPAPQVPKPALNLDPPRRPGPGLGAGPAKLAVPLKGPIVPKKAPVSPTKAFNRVAHAPVRATPAFNRAAAPARTQGPTRTRTR